MTHLKNSVGIKEVRVIDETINRLKRDDNKEVSIFHGRDLFGFCAARLASGIITYEEVGPTYPLDEIVLHDIKKPEILSDAIRGIFEINDPNFGNLWTNIALDDFNKLFKHGEKIKVIIRHDGQVVFNEVLPYFSSFGMAPKGSVMIYNNELNKIALAMVMGNLCKSYDLGYGENYEVLFRKVSVHE